MKQKFMMVAMLAGVLTLGSCVDNEESPSTTAVRNAKVEQIKAAAALDNARAQAELIEAEARAAYDKAQAKYQEALAANQEFNLQKAKEQYALELEAITLEAQNRLLQAKIDAAGKEQAFLSLTNDLLKELYNEYANELYWLDDYKAQLNQQNLWLAQYEVQSISVEKANATQKAIHENNILTYQAQIEAYKAYEGMDKAELEAEALTLQTKKDNLYMDYLRANQLVNATQQAYNDIYQDFFASNGENSELKTLAAAYTLWNEFNGGIIDWEEVVIAELEDGTTFEFPKYSIVSEYELENQRQQLAASEKYYKDQLGAPKTESAAATGYYATLETYQANLKTAQDAKNQTDIDLWTLQIAQVNDQINQCKEDLAEATQRSADFEAAIATFSGDDYKAYEAAIEALKKNEAVLAYAEAWEAQDVADDAYNDANNAYYAANNLASNGVDAKAQILILEDNIADEQLSIANLTNDYESLIQDAKDNIARLTTQIEMQEAVVELAKKNLDNAIAAQGETEETPAE